MKKAQDIDMLQRKNGAQVLSSGKLMRRSMFQELRAILHRFKTTLDIDIAAFLSPVVPDPDDDEVDTIISNSRNIPYISTHARSD